MRIWGIFLASAIGLLLLAFGQVAHAHDSRPLYVELREMEANRYQLQWRVPPSVPLPNLPEVSLSPGCRNLTESARAGQLAEPVGAAYYLCGQSPGNQSIRIRYPLTNPSVSTIINFQTRTGEHHTVLLGPERALWRLPSAETTESVARDYALLGIRHIWSGVDHLLFLICLLWIAGTPSRILMTVTGFTIAHSLTLALAALHIVQVAVPPAEATIALSIVFLAREIFKGTRETLTWRYPIAVSSSFGLLHGLGFAAVLSDIGLPQTEVATGLLFFNIGVEIGQLIFVGAALGLFLLARRLHQRALGEVIGNTRLRLASSGLVGVIAAFWLIERVSTFSV